MLGMANRKNNKNAKKILHIGVFLDQTLWNKDTKKYFIIVFLTFSLDLNWLKLFLPYHINPTIKIVYIIDNHKKIPFNLTG